MIEDLLEMCERLRKAISRVESEVARIPEHLDDGDGRLSPGNVPPTRNANVHANTTLAFRHLEDARMRLGKVMQAYQGGVSILDREGS